MDSPDLEIDGKIDIQQKQRATRKLSSPFLLAFLLLLLTAVIFWNWYGPGSLEAARLETMSFGNQIINALEVYRTENGGYPDSLKLLVPKYLPDIQPPVWGQDGWQYVSSSPEFYVITVGYRDGCGSYCPSMHYCPGQEKNEWVYDN